MTASVSDLQDFVCRDKGTKDERIFWPVGSGLVYFLITLMQRDTFKVCGSFGMQPKDNQEREKCHDKQYWHNNYPHLTHQRGGIFQSPPHAWALCKRELYFLLRNLGKLSSGSGACSVGNTSIMGHWSRQLCDYFFDAAWRQGNFQDRALVAQVWYLYFSTYVRACVCVCMHVWDWLFVCVCMRVCVRAHVSVRVLSVCVCPGACRFECLLFKRW